MRQTITVSHNTFSKMFGEFRLNFFLVTIIRRRFVIVCEFFVEFFLLQYSTIVIVGLEILF